MNPTVKTFSVEHRLYYFCRVHLLTMVRINIPGIWLTTQRSHSIFQCYLHRYLQFIATLGVKDLFLSKHNKALHELKVRVRSLIFIKYPSWCELKPSFLAVNKTCTLLHNLLVPYEIVSHILHKGVFSSRNLLPTFLC